jgi:hypothetical protein
MATGDPEEGYAMVADAMVADLETVRLAIVLRKALYGLRTKGARWHKEIYNWQSRPG